MTGIGLEPSATAGPGAPEATSATAAPVAPLVEVEGLTFRYRRASEPAIRDVSLTVRCG